MNIDKYKAAMKREAMRHGFESTTLKGFGTHLSSKQRSKLHFHQLHWLASVYGAPVRSVERFVGRDGELTLRGIDKARRAMISLPSFEEVREHRVHRRWMDGLLAVDEMAKMGHRELSLQLRGVSRAVWLAVLWAGQDVSALRPTWYHWTDTQPYWDIAWACYRSAGAADRLLRFARGLLWRYSELHPAHREHAAAQYIRAAESLLGSDRAHQHYTPYPLEAA